MMVFAILPIYLVDVLKISYTKAGLMEGFAIFIAFLFKVFAGVISDIFRIRRPLIALGSLLSVLVKLIYCIGGSFPMIFMARFMDRLSKGVRSSPTDALIADLSTPQNQGRNFGLRQSLYTLGALTGATIATVLMYVSKDHYRLIFLTSMIPAIIALCLLIFSVKQPIIPQEIKKKHTSWHIRDIAFLPPEFWQLLSVSFILMMARFSESFITYRAKSIGWPIALLPLLIIVMDLAHAALAYPIGLLADKISRKEMLLRGLFLLAITNIIFISTNDFFGIFAATVCNGFHMGMTQGLLAALIAESAPAELRGTAFALFYLSTGTAVLIGNSLAGYLCDTYGTTGGFMGGLVFTTLSGTLLYLFILKSRRTASTA